MEYTAEQLNFFRLCYIVFDIVPKCLRQLFKQQWDALYSAKHGQWDDTPVSYTAFENIESPRNRSRNKRLLGLMSSGDREKWDCTCLFYAILYSDSVGPGLTTVVSKSVDEIREIRNELAHNKTGKMSKAEFQTSIQKIKLAFSSLSLDISRIEEIENQNDFPTEDLTTIRKELQKTVEELKNVEKELEDEKKRNAEPNSFCVLPPHPSHDTVDRKKEVDEIYQAMEKLSSENKGKATLVYLSGNPGSGKSVMASHIAEKYYDASTETLKFVMTLDASTIESLLNSYTTFAEKLNCYPDSITSITTSKDLSKEEQILQLKSLASKQVDKCLKWWIIADNVTDLKKFSKYWPHGGEKNSGEGQILVTTQDSPSIAVSLNSYCHHVSISSGMVEEDALQLLSKVSGYTNAEQDMMLKVCKALDFQPLALSSTAVYVRSARTINKQYTWFECLRDLQSEREKLEMIYQNTSLVYKTTMTASVNLALKREISEEIMLYAFRFLSVIASEPIPLEYVVAYVAKCMPDEDKNTVAVRICSSSLIRSFEVKETMEISVHQVVFHCLQRSEDIAENAVDIFTVISAFSLIPNIDEKYPIDGLISTRPLMCHLVKVAGRVKDYVINKSRSERLLDEHVCDLLLRLSSVLYQQYNLESSRDFCCVSLALQISLFTLPKAREVLIVLMDTNHVEYISNLNPNIIHASVADTMNDLGNTYQELGQLQESITYCEKAISIKRAAYGENHPMVGQIMTNLGNTYKELGRLQESETYYEKALTILTAAYGENHPSVAGAINGLGNTYQALWRLQESKTLYKKALAINTGEYGENHLFGAEIMTNLANVCNKLGRLQESITYCEKALTIKRVVYSENHPTLAVTIISLGNACQKLGRLQESITYYEEALAINKAAYGENHPKLAVSMNNLGITYRKLGRLQESITYYKKALAIKTAAYGENHPSVADTINSLGIAFEEQGRFNEAKTCYHQALAIYKSNYDENHPYIHGTKMNLNNLAMKSALARIIV